MKTRFTRLVPIKATEPTYGEHVPTLLPAQDLWGNLDPVPMKKGMVVDFLGAPQHRVDWIIRINNFPDLEVMDQLIHKVDNTRFEIDSIYPDYDQGCLVLTAHTPARGTYIGD